MNSINDFCCKLGGKVPQNVKRLIKIYVSNNIIRNTFFRNYQTITSLNGQEYETLQLRCHPHEHIENRSQLAQFLSTIVIYLKEIYPKTWNYLNIIDIGTREGWTLDFLQQLGFKQPVGVELVQSYVDYAQKLNRKVVKSDGINLAFPDCTFDIVLSRHTLEHSNNPVKLLQEMIRILKLGGLIILNFPLEIKPIGKHCTAIPSKVAFKKLLKDTYKEEILRTKFMDRPNKFHIYEEDNELLFIGKKI